MACLAKRGVYVGKAPVGLVLVVKGLVEQLALLTIVILLLPDVPTHGGFVTAHRAHPVPGCPKVQPSHPSLMQQLTMDTHRTLAFQKTYRVRHTVLGRDAQAQVNMVAHRMPFQQLNPLLLTQIPQDCANRCPQLSLDHFPSVFRNEDHVILAFPTHVCQTLKILHTLLLLPSRALPGVRAYVISGHAGTA